MKMPPPPGPELGTKGRLVAWIGRHKIASGLIGLLAFLLVVGAISNSAGGATSNQAAASSVATTSATASPSKPAARGREGSERQGTQCAAGPLKS
jgi:hypothetical protein